MTLCMHLNSACQMLLLSETTCNPYQKKSTQLSSVTSFKTTTLASWFMVDYPSGLWFGVQEDQFSSRAMLFQTLPSCTYSVSLWCNVISYGSLIPSVSSVKSYWSLIPSRPSSKARALWYHLCPLWIYSSYGRTLERVVASGCSPTLTHPKNKFQKLFP